MSTNARNSQHDAEFAAGKNRSATSNETSASAGGANLKKPAPTVLKSSGSGLNAGRFSRGGERHYGSVKRMPTTTVNTTR